MTKKPFIADKKFSNVQEIVEKRFLSMQNVRFENCHDSFTVSSFQGHLKPWNLYF